MTFLFTAVLPARPPLKDVKLVMENVAAPARRDDAEESSSLSDSVPLPGNMLETLVASPLHTYLLSAHTFVG